MEAPEIRTMIATMRRLHGEPDGIEVKSGAGGFPKSTVDSIVSFANTDGGTIVIGIDESDDFSLTDITDPAAYRDAAIGQAKDGVEPPVSIAVEMVEVDGARVIVIEVPEADSVHKPVCIARKGLPTGALIRDGDGDRRMTPSEIGLLYASRSHPDFDTRPVPDATLSDLDHSVVVRTLERVRSEALSMRNDDDETVLLRIRAAARDGDVLRPTLAGLLAFGVYPQQFYPQLHLSFVAFPQQESVGGERFLDNVAVRGNIPSMVREAVAAVRRNLSARTTVTGEGRAERFTFSLEAVREAVVNALLHRDYSDITRGVQVQVELYPDRLVVRSPGGIYGPVSVAQLGQHGVSSSRNSVLAGILADTYVPGTDRLVAENRASGVPTIIREARLHGQVRPSFESTVTNFTVTMSSSGLLAPEVIAWLDSLRGLSRSRERDIALAMLFRGSVTNEMLREWGMDRIDAGKVLRELVTAGYAVKEGGRRYATYMLAEGAESPEEHASGTDSPNAPTTLDQIAEELRSRGAVSAKELADLLGLHRNTVLRALNEGVEQGRVGVEGAARSPSRRYTATLLT